MYTSNAMIASTTRTTTRIPTINSLGMHLLPWNADSPVTRTWRRSTRLAIFDTKWMIAPPQHVANDWVETHSRSGVRTDAPRVAKPDVRR